MAFSYKSIFGSFRDDFLTTFYVLVRHVRGWPSSLGLFLRALGNILGFGLDFFIENLRFTIISTTWIFLIVFVYFFFPDVRPCWYRAHRVFCSPTQWARVSIIVDHRFPKTQNYLCTDDVMKRKIVCVFCV